MGIATSTMAAKLAFFPPNPPSYTVVTEESTGKMMISTNLPHYLRDENIEVVKIRTKRGNEIVAMYVKNPTAKLTVLFSHGNASDLAQIFYILAELIQLNVNLMGLVCIYVRMNCIKLITCLFFFFWILTVVHTY